MKITAETVEEVILGEIGRRLAQVRLGQNLTQAQVAERAGVSKRTVERLETGGAAPQLTGFIGICRALGLVERFELLVP
jgi:transcriptional regulator with XRE-family HTH domain